MKRTGPIACVCLAVGLAHGAAASARDDHESSSAPVSQNTSTATLDALLSPPSKVTTGVNNLRAKMLVDAGHTVGFRGGLINRAGTLIKGLEARKESLGMLYEFSTLISPTGTIPPVIVEASDAVTFSADQIRTAGHVYKIEREERFVSVPPAWGDYLYAGLAQKGDVELPIFEARPQDAKEALIWRDAVRSGWEEGRKQADAILEANFNRLTRDYAGMILYSSLRQQAMISSTRVSELTQTVTGDGKQIMLDDKLRRVVGKARFEPNADKWQPTVTDEQRTAAGSELAPSASAAAAATRTSGLP